MYGSKPKGLEIVARTKWNARFPFGNFGRTFKKSRFLWKFSVWEDQVSLSIDIPIEILGFSG